MPPKTKTGEGIVIVLDVSPAVRASSSITFYSQAKQCLIHILQRKIFAEKCQDLVGVILFGTDDTKNALAKGNQYQHISVLQEPKLVDWKLIKDVEQLPRGNSSGDWLDALVIAMDLLHDPQGIYFSTKKIVLMTDFASEFTDDQLSRIIGGLKEMNIELSVIGPSFEDDDDADENDLPHTESNGSSPKPPKLNWNGKPKSNIQLAGETLVRRIVSEVDGMICSFDEAIAQLIFFEKKSQASAAWNATLDVGPSLRIPITGRIKVKHATQPSWKKILTKDETIPIHVDTSYHKVDEHQTVVQEDDVISGYRYGTTLVPFSDEDMQLHYSSNANAAELSVLGFTTSSYVPLSLRTGDQVLIVTAKDHDEDAAVALSALIQALGEMNMVAITRRIYRKNLNPVMGVLFPDITSDYECLVWIALPFQEDVRNFSFPSLAKITNDLQQAHKDAMDKFIDAYDLSTKSDDEDEEEEFSPTLILNPQLQHFYNCLTHRAISPDEPLPGPSQHILDILKPSDERQTQSAAILKRLSELFPLKREVIAKKKIDLSTSDDAVASTSSATDGEHQPISSDDLKGQSVTKITSATPASDFKKLLSSGDLPNYSSICKEMEDVLLHLTETLTGSAAGDDTLLRKIILAMKTFREEALMIDPTPYNDFMVHLKRLVVARKFRHLWILVKEENLGQIILGESLKSKISKEEAENFLQPEFGDAEAKEAPKEELINEYDDMLDDL